MSKSGYILNRDGVERSGEGVDDLLDKIEDLADATTTTSGLMSKTDKKKLDELEDCEELSIDEVAALINF